MKQKLRAVAAWICAVGWSLVLLAFSVFPEETRAVWMSDFIKSVCDTLTVSQDGWPAAVIPWALALCVYALLAVLWQWAVTPKAVNIGIALGTAMACAGRMGGRVWLFALVDVLGVCLGVVAIILWQFAWKRFPRVFNRETVNYVIFGVLTTVVNIVSYMVTVAVLPFGEMANTAVANAVAWVLSVLFAYVVNKLCVFQSHTTGAKALLWEAGKFIGARVFSFGVDELGMLLLVNVIRMPDFWAKVLTNILVMIMNYFFSKLIIFKGDKKEE